MKGADELRREERWGLFYLALGLAAIGVPWWIGFTTLVRWLIEATQ